MATNEFTYSYCKHCVTVPHIKKAQVFGINKKQ